MTLDEEDSTKQKDDHSPQERSNTTRGPQHTRPPVTCGDRKSLTDSAQQLLAQMGLEHTLENLVTALFAKLTQNSVNVLVLMIMLFCCCTLATGNPVESDFLTSRTHYNIWICLAEIVNSSEISIHQDINIRSVLGSCLLPVCHPAHEIANMTMFSKETIKKPIFYKDSYNWGNPQYAKPSNAMILLTPTVALNVTDACTEIQNCTHKCVSLGRPSFNCTKVEPIIYGNGYTPLPPG